MQYFIHYCSRNILRIVFHYVSKTKVLAYSRHSCHQKCLNYPLNHVRIFFFSFLCSIFCGSLKVNFLVVFIVGFTFIARNDCEFFVFCFPWCLDQFVQSLAFLLTSVDVHVHILVDIVDRVDDWLHFLLTVELSLPWCFLSCW